MRFFELYPAIRDFYLRRQDNLYDHGLRTPDEGINQRNLKIWADVADKIFLGLPKYLGVGVDFRSFSEGDFLSGCP